MAQVKAAIDALELSPTENKRCHTLVQKALAATIKNERLFSNKMNSTSAALSLFNSAHNAWLPEDELGEDQVKYKTNWHETHWSEVGDL